GSYEVRFCGVRCDTLVGGCDPIGVQFRVIEFGVDVTRRPLPQLQSRPRWNRFAPAASGIRRFQQFSDAAQVVNFLSIGLQTCRSRNRTEGSWYAGLRVLGGG